MSAPQTSLRLETVGKGPVVGVLVVKPDDRRVPFGRGDIAKPTVRSKIARDVVRQFSQLKLDDVVAILEELAFRSLPKTREVATASAGEAEYFVRDGRTYWRKSVGEQTIEVQLANFTANVEAENCLDDGVEVAIEFCVRAVVAGVERHETVCARDFNDLRWVPERLGANAIVEAGVGLRERMRVAVQQGDGSPVPRRTVYTHTGWREVDPGRWVYLHGGGPIGPVGPLTGVEVRLPQSLSPFMLPEPPTGAELASACAAALAMQSTLPKLLGFALLATATRAALGGTDFSVFLVGTTGAFKSELAALAQSFFGPEFERQRLPASWSATSNYLEQLAFTAKDAVLVVDDYAPTGSRTDVKRYHREADRLLRAQGNRSGRGRLTAESQPMDAKPPRGLILVTGEDLPPGVSLRARCLIIEIGKGDVRSGDLSTCQEHARSGRYAQTMAAFLKHAAADYPGMKRRVAARAAELRKEAQSEYRHLRTSGAVAELQAGFEEFLVFVRLLDGHGVLQVPETLRDDCWAALLELASAQSSQQSSVQPVQLFLDFLRQAIVGGQAHIADVSGGAPTTHDAMGLGWELRTPNQQEEATYSPRGPRIGWIDGSDLYLLPEASLRAAQDMADDSSRIPVSASRLTKQLGEGGLLLSKDSCDGHLTARRTIAGTRHRVIHMSVDTLLGVGQLGQLGHAADASGREMRAEPSADLPGAAAEGQVRP